MVFPEEVAFRSMLEPLQIVVALDVTDVGVDGKAFTITVYVAVAAPQSFNTVIVKVTVFPASPAAGVYTGVNVVAPEVIEPAPFSVQAIVPFDDVAPLTVAVLF